MIAYTDYPIVPLGDEPYQLAPVRQVIPLMYDGDKRCIVFVQGNRKGHGVVGWIKRGYIYTEPKRADDKPTLADVNKLEVDLDTFLSVEVAWS